MKKLATFKIAVEVEDDGQFDEYIMRDALVDLYFKGLNEGMFTALHDETTMLGTVTITVDSFGELK